MLEQVTPQSLAPVTSAQVVILAVIVMALTMAGSWLWVLIDLLTWPSSTWDSSGLSRARWVSRVFLLGWIGAVWYMHSARRHLKTTYAEVRSARKDHHNLG
ncbi:hypothetical protein [Nocardioides sp.]|uniref:hypothetical protein n=1 Tax=Nocardioides sp. TaxID=35761 RepID=UPI00271D6F87|nr:hypothetical protein [Nocardioides sp.]MDO9454504.1 hypothetical protein [Nocardioides sp.]